MANTAAYSGLRWGEIAAVTVERVLGSMNVIMALDGVPGTDVRMTPAEVKGSDPGKLIIRLENRLGGLESLRSRSLTEIGQLTAEAAHARDDLARPFPQVGQLTAARDRVLRLEEKLRETAAPSQDNGHDWLLAAAVSGAAAMAGIPNAPTAASHQDGRPQSPAQISQRDFPVDNPLTGTTLAVGQVIPKPGSRQRALPATSHETLDQLTSFRTRSWPTTWSRRSVGRAPATGRGAWASCRPSAPGRCWPTCWPPGRRRWCG
jgi:hypothetical protein